MKESDAKVLGESDEVERRKIGQGGKGSIDWVPQADTGSFLFRSELLTGKSIVLGLQSWAWHFCLCVCWILGSTWLLGHAEPRFVWLGAILGEIGLASWMPSQVVLRDDSGNQAVVDGEVRLAS